MLITEQSDCTKLQVDDVHETLIIWMQDFLSQILHCGLNFKSTDYFHFNSVLQ